MIETNTGCHGAEMVRVEKWIFFGALALALATPIIIIFHISSGQFAWSNHDVIATLNAAERVYFGEVIYKDWIETNPPTIYILSFASLFFAKVFHLDPIAIHYSLYFACVSLLLLIVALQLKVDYLQKAAFCVCVISLLLLTPLLFWEAFQREHFFVLSLPFFMMATPDRLPLRWPRVIICFGVAFLAQQKPHFLVVVTIIDLFSEHSLLKRLLKKEISPELIAFVVGLFAPLVVLLLHSPSAIVALFTKTLDIHLSGVYGTFKNDVARGVYWFEKLEFWKICVLNAVVIGSGLVLRKYKQTILVLIITVFAWACLYQQHKFWEYHFILPFGIMVLGLWWLCFFCLFQKPTGNLRILAILICLIFMVRTLLLLGTDTSVKNRVTHWERLQPLLDGYNTVMVLSPSLTTICLPGKMPRCIGDRAHLIYLGALQRIADANEREEKMTAWAKDISHAIERFEPDAIVFGASRQSLSMTTAHGSYQKYGIPLESLGYEMISNTELLHCCSTRAVAALYRKMAQ